MRKLLLAVPAALALLLVAGCEPYDSSASPSSRSAVEPAQAQTAPAPAPAPAYTRNTTTQPLPAGWSYVNERDLSTGPLARGQ